VLKESRKMGKIKNDLPISQKIAYLMVILFFVLCMPINEIRAFADKFDTLQNRLEWYKSNHPIPYDGVNDKGECNEVVGYLGSLTWTAGEGQQIWGCEPGQTCNITGTIGETTDKTTYLEEITYSSSDSDLPDDYVFSVFGFLRCTEPVLRIEPEKEVMLVNEMIPIKVYLDCGYYEICEGQPVILEIISGPGELDLPELTSDELNRLRDLGYSASAENIIMTNLMIAEAMLYATDVGTIEIKATYESCRAEAYKSTITETAIVHVGQKEAKFSGTIFFNRNLEWDKETSNESGSASGVGYLRESATLQVTLKYTNTYQGRDYYKVEDASGTYQYSYDSKEEYWFHGEPIYSTITRSAHDSGSLEHSHIHCLLLHDPEKKKYTFTFSFTSPLKDGTETISDGPPSPLPWGMEVDEYEYEGDTDGRTFTGFWQRPEGNVAVGAWNLVGLAGSRASWTFVKP